MRNVYIITSGEYSEYSIDSVWSSKEEAERLCALLNVGRGYEDYRVEEHSLNVSYHASGYLVSCYRAEYDYSVHGLNLDVSNIEFKDAAWARADLNRVLDDRSKVSVLGETKDKCLRMLADRLAEKKAEEEGVIW